MNSGNLRLARRSDCTKGRPIILRRFFVPGRIEVLGKHTDYAGGRSLLCAVERGFRVAVVPREDAIVTVTDWLRGEREVLSLDPDLPDGEQRHWSTYPRVVARRLARNFPRARHGADIVFRSDLPQAAGLSSSSALMVAIFLALAAVNNLEKQEEYARAIRDREELATYLACVENGSSFGPLEGDRGVGTTGGSEDHVAMLCSEEGTLGVYSFSPVRRERMVAMPVGYVFAVGASGVLAQKAGAAMAHYNQASAQSLALLDRWNRLTGRLDLSLGAAMATLPDALDRLRGALLPEGDAPLLARLEQFVEESTVLVPAAAEALAAGDLTTFGLVVDRSQDLAEAALGNQVPETVALARSARRLGAVAASAFGAGFGGSVWALVSKPDAEAFVEGWAAQYRRDYSQRAAASRFFITGAGPAASEV